MRRHISWIFALAVATCGGAWYGIAAAQDASVQPTVETGSAHTSGDNADDSAIWIHPTDPALSLVIGDDKGGGLMVWNLAGTELQYLDGTNYNNLDLRYNFPLAGSYSGGGGAHTRVALVVVNDEINRQLDCFKVNPTTRQLEPAGSIPTAANLEPYGGCMYVSPVTNKFYYFVNAKSGVCQQYELSDAGGGNVGGTMVRSFDVGGQTEGSVADDVHAQFYIGEEAVGVFRYGAEPGDGSTRVQVDRTGSGGNLVADVEGLGIYYNSNGSGYLIVSSQGNSRFYVYHRQTPNAYIGSFNVVANGSIDAVSGTDGLDVTNFPMGSGFPQGMLVVHDSSNSGGSASNHKYVPWQNVANAMGLVIDTTWDPRLVGGGGGGPVVDTTPPAAITDLSVGSAPNGTNR